MDFNEILRRPTKDQPFNLNFGGDLILNPDPWSVIRIAIQNFSTYFWKS